jgi:hypothetical protein
MVLADETTGRTTMQIWLAQLIVIAALLSLTARSHRQVWMLPEWCDQGGVVIVTEGYGYGSEQG